MQPGRLAPDTKEKYSVLDISTEYTLFCWVKLLKLQLDWMKDESKIMIS